MAKYCIGLDLDGVIIDHSMTVQDLIMKKHPEVDVSNVPFAQLDMAIDKASQSALFDEMYETQHGSDKSVLMPGAYEGINMLLEEGHELHIISRRNTPLIAITTLERLNLWPSIFNESNTHFAERSFRKTQIAQELGVTHYIDDQPNALETTMAHIEHKYLYDQFNVFEAKSIYIKVNTWSEFVESVIPD